jgi:hypothetical protein
MQKRTSHRVKKFSHYVIGFAIFMEGISEAEDFARDWPYVILFCAIGMVIWIFTFYEEKIEQKWVSVPVLINILESVVLFIMGMIYIHEGKHWLPYIIFLAAAASLTAGIIRCIRLSKK